ncbi:nucleotide-binding protein [Burkholderia cepacia]|uniref:nucleotide-binding protein n=1 Tax=Burkholderia TaxID=32008 RepID=UPI002FE3D7DE
MARAKPEETVAPKLQLSPSMIQRGIGRLNDRIAELQAFDASSVPEGLSPALTALSADIKDTLDRCFGENTSVYKRFQSAAHLQFRTGVFTDTYPQRHHYVEGTKKNIAQSIVLLEAAKRALQEDLEDAQHTPASVPPPMETEEPALSRRVFVVHGHDGEAREAVARFLEKIGFEAIILHEQANQGRTIIEKIEANDDVGFAVVLLTPDDEGCVKGGEPKARARQNVMLELGYFIGKLGRDKVCALKRGELEIPSDYLGVVWVAMDSGDGWKRTLGQELQAAGHDIDWNRVMRP